MPAAFPKLELDASSFDEAYRAGRESAVALDRGYLTTIEVKGKDSESFLQNMLSGDVKKLVPGHGRPATFLTSKGKLVADFIVLRGEDGFYLDVEAVRGAPLVAALDRYIISEDVTLTPKSEETRFSLEGPEAAERLEHLMEASSPLAELPHLGFARGSRRGIEAPSRIVAYRKEPSPRFDVAAPAALCVPLLAELLEAGAVAGGAPVRETRRIEAGRARFGVDIDEGHMPLEAGLDEAVSFDKGCYIGQEYVVRLAHRGHLNRKLCGLTIESSEPPAPGSVVVAKQAETRDAGHVTSAAYSPTLGSTVALAWLKRDFFEPGTGMLVAGAEAVVTSLPFVPPAVP